MGDVPSRDRQLLLDQWARKDAKNDNSGPSCQSFDQRIQQITNLYTATVTTEFINGFRSRSDELLEKFADIEGRIQSNPDTFVARKEVDAVAAKAAADSHVLPKIIASDAEYQEWSMRFKTDLLQGVLNPKKKNVALHWGLLLFLLAVEAILNSRFFAETSEFGLLGGTMAAVTVSVVNVGLPLLVGYFTYKLYYNRIVWSKYVGLMLAVALVILAAKFNFEVAEYRDLLLISSSKPPSSLPEYYALLVIGGGIAIISFWKMFSFMDQFHRPRRCYRARLAAIEEYTMKALKPITDAQHEVQKLARQLSVAVANTDAFIAQQKLDFDHECEQATQMCNSDITVYYIEYAPLHADPDPDKPEFSVQDLAFSSGRVTMEKTIASLEHYRDAANSQCRPILAQVETGLDAAHKRFQAVVMASLPPSLP